MRGLAINSFLNYSAQHDLCTPASDRQQTGVQTSFTWGLDLKLNSVRLCKRVERHLHYNDLPSQWFHQRYSLHITSRKISKLIVFFFKCSQRVIYYLIWESTTYRFIYWWLRKDSCEGNLYLKRSFREPNFYST